MAASAPNEAAAHLPISSPAKKLSVAKVISAESIGSSGVSNAMTTMPASRACLTADTMDDVSDAVSRMPLAPSAMQVSMAATWVSWSPSTLPANDFRVMPNSLALAVAPSFIFTKKGLVSVLVIKQAVMSAANAVLDIIDSVKAAQAINFFILFSLKNIEFWQIANWPS